MHVFVLTTFHEEVLLKRVLVVYVFFLQETAGKYKHDTRCILVSAFWYLKSHDICL